MPQQHLRVLMSFTRGTDSQVVEAASAVLAGLTGNKAYPSPPVDLAALETATTEFSAAIAAQTQGGTTATADKNRKRKVVVVYLRKLAGYVQAHCDDDLTVLLSSGFQAVNNTGRRTQLPLDKPVISSVDNGRSGQLLVSVDKQANARAYQVQFALVGAGGALGPMQDGGYFTKSRSIPINDLTPGAIYMVQVRVIGGADGHSDWSDPVSHMST